MRRNKNAVNKILTMEKIRAQYAGNYVLIEFVELDEDMQIVRGKVIAHSANGNEIFQEFIKHRSRNAPVALEYLGPLPDEIVVV